MPCVSNLQALEDERTELYHDLDMSHHNGTPKSAKQAILNRIYEIERSLGIKSIPYNSNAFGRR